MSVTFTIRGETPNCSCTDLSAPHCPKCGHPIYSQDCECQYICDACTDRMFNMSNANARDFFQAIGVDSRDLCGEATSRDLRRRAERIVRAAVDPGLPTYVDATAGQAMLINCGRPEGYLRERAEDLLKLCELVGDLGRICWG